MRKKIILTLLIAIVLIVSTVLINQWQKKNTYYFDVFIRHDLVLQGTEGILEGDIYAEEWWQSQGTVKRKDVSKAWMDYAKTLEWTQEVSIPERLADEIISVRKNGTGYIHWKIWYLDDDKVLIVSTDNTGTTVDKDTFDDIQRN